jgi:NAD(P)-dependent dehydrogenase (short-subunit alcohol dehydrogenase family)
VDRLSGRRALVMGAGQGIGRAIALAFAREGADVAVLDIQSEAVAATSAEIVGLGRASVINFASNAGTEGMPRNAAYAAAKEAIRGFSRSLAREWAADKIRVNMIRPIAASPGTVEWGEAFPA